MSVCVILVHAGEPPHGAEWARRGDEDVSDDSREERVRERERERERKSFRSFRST